MSNCKQFWFPLLITILLVSLILSFHSFLLTNIVKPIALLLWALWRIIASVDQNVYWIAMIVFCSILVFRLFPSGNDQSAESAYNSRDKSFSRVEHWQTLIRNATLSKNESNRLNDSLKNLLASVAASDDQSEPTKLEEIIARGESPLSFTSQRLLFPQNGTPRNFSIGQKLNLLSLAPRWLRRWMSRFVHRDYTLIDDTLRWMEAELEINDEK